MKCQCLDIRNPLVISLALVIVVEIVLVIGLGKGSGNGVLRQSKILPLTLLLVTLVGSKSLPLYGATLTQVDMNN